MARADTQQARERLRELLGGCVKTGRITLASGRETDFYFDGRLVSLTPEGSTLIARLFVDELRALGATAVGGLTSGADPITSSIGVIAWLEELPLQLFYVRKSPKAHGRQRRVEGPDLAPDAKAVLVDDVLTTGGSLLLARDALREDAGLEAAGAIVIIDREEGGKERLEAEGIEVRSLFRKADFLA